MYMYKLSKQTKQMKQNKTKQNPNKSNQNEVLFYPNNFMENKDDWKPSLSKCSNMSVLFALAK